MAVVVVEVVVDAVVEAVVVDAVVETVVVEVEVVTVLVDVVAAVVVPIVKIRLNKILFRRLATNVTPKIGGIWL